MQVETWGPCGYGTGGGGNWEGGRQVCVFRGEMNQAFRISDAIETGTVQVGEGGSGGGERPMEGGGKGGRGGGWEGHIGTGRGGRWEGQMGEGGRGRAGQRRQGGMGGGRDKKDRVGKRGGAKKTGRMGVGGVGKGDGCYGDAGSAGGGVDGGGPVWRATAGRAQGASGGRGRGRL